MQDTGSGAVSTTMATTDEQHDDDRWGISQAELQRRREREPPAAKPEERHCPECGYRVTQTENYGEVGHANGYSQPECPLHPDSDKEPSGQTSIGEW